MLTPALQQIVFGGYDALRTRLLNDLSAIAGKPVAGWLPHRSDALTSVCPWSGRVWTAEATMQGRLVPQGKGVGLTFNGTSNYLATPDTNDISFGNGTTDSPFSIFVVANVTDTAAVRRMVSKITGAASGEYHLSVDGADLFKLGILDASVPAQPNATASAAITQGSICTFAGTYSAVSGGASAANDIVIYQNGAVFASAAGNVGTYVAMENSSVDMEIGASDAHTVGFFTGTIYAAVVIPAALTAAQLAALHNRARAYFGF